MVAIIVFIIICIVLISIASSLMESLSSSLRGKVVLFLLGTILLLGIGGLVFPPLMILSGAAFVLLIIYAIIVLFTVDRKSVV